MRHMIIRDARNTLKEVEDHFLYIYRDGDTVLYVGKSIHPFKRLRQHIQHGMFRGLSMYHCTIELLTLEDCTSTVYRFGGTFGGPTISHGEAFYDSYRRFAHNNPQSRARCMDAAEKCLIKKYAPLRNVAWNTQVQRERRYVAFRELLKKNKERQENTL